MRHLCHRLEVQHLQAGITKRLGEDEACLRADRLGECGGVARIDGRAGDAEARQRVHEHIVRAAVDAR